MKVGSNSPKKSCVIGNISEYGGVNSMKKIASDKTPSSSRTSNTIGSSLRLIPFSITMTLLQKLSDNCFAMIPPAVPEPTIT